MLNLTAATLAIAMEIIAKQFALHDHGHDVHAILEASQTFNSGAAIGVMHTHTHLCWLVDSQNPQ